jgi:hypothetical protein
MSAQRIASGLAAATADDLAPDLRKAPKTPTDVINIAESAARLHEKHSKTIARLENDFAAQRQRIERAADDGRLRGEARTKFIANAVNEARRELRKASSEERMSALRELQTLSQQAELSRHLMASPVSMLSVAGIGSEQRARYEAMLERAGPQAIATYAKHAEAHNDSVLGAAVLNVLDRMPRDKRPVSQQHLADRLMGATYSDIEAARKRATNAFTAALNANRAFEAGTRVPSALKIKQALNNRDADKLEAIAASADGEA